MTTDDVMRKALQMAKEQLAGFKTAKVKSGSALQSQTAAKRDGSGSKARSERSNQSRDKLAA